MANPDQALTLTEKQIRELPAWKSLVEDTKPHREMIRQGELTLLEGYWRIGLRLNEDKQNRVYGYGDNFVEIFSAEHNYHANLIWDAMLLAKEFPTWNAVTGLLDNLAKQGASRTWTSVRNRKRLLGLPDPKTDAKRAADVGGNDRQTNNLMNDLEGSVRRIQEYAENGIPDEIRAIFSGPTFNIAVDLIQLAEKIQPGIIAEHAEVPQQEATQEVEIEILEDVSIETRHMEFTAQMNCTFCNKEDRGKTVIQLPWPDDKRPDWQLTNCCELHANEADDIMNDETKVWGSIFWSKYRYNIIDWFYQFGYEAVKQREHWRSEALKSED